MNARERRLAAAALRARLSEAQNHRCCYCGRVMHEDPSREDGVSLEHLQARADGGLTTYENCVAACRACNRTRGRKNPRRFYSGLQRGYWSPQTQQVAA